MTFKAIEIDTPENVQIKLYWGREIDKDHCWAGFIYQLQTEAVMFEHFTYAVRFEERE